MIGYVTLGTNDLAAATAFYDAVFATIDVGQLYATPRLVAWGPSRTAPAFCVNEPHDREPATVGNGVMIALQVADQAQVHAVYDQALALGATDEGAPGPRGTSGFYAGYFRDLDGNKINAFTFG